MVDPEATSNPYRELAKRFFITFLLAVVVYRIGIVVPVPGIDVAELQDKIQGTTEDGSAVGSVLKMANMFNGGALANGSVFGLGIMPYISASIIFQLLAFSMPALKALQKEGEVGRRKIQQYTRYMTLAICLVQSIVAAIALQSTGFVRADVDPVMFIVQSALVVTTGSMVLLWIAEQVTKFGVGNGVSVVIMISILAGFPSAIDSIMNNTETDTLLSTLLGLLILFALIIAFMVAVTMARRIIHLEQQRRVQGGRQYGGGQTKLPLMLNHAGVIPVIFAQPVMMVLGLVLANLLGLRLVQSGEAGYRYLLIALVVFFTFFYISITIDLNEWANNFKNGGFFIKGVKPGKNTADYLRYRLTRLTFVGAISLAAITIVPQMLGTEVLQIDQQASMLLLGGIGLLIVVGVSLDVIQKVTSFLLAHQYQGLMSKNTGAGGPKGGTGKSGRGGKRF